MPSIEDLIASQARRTGADPLTMLATAIVESNLNPNAVGDGGTSFGLYQMHVGGAGGSTLQSAKQYLNPIKAIENRARAFRGGSGGAFAASVQRPADQAGYAKKVDAVIAQLRAGKRPGGAGLLNAPVVSGGATGPSAGTSGKSAALSLIFGDDPVFAMAAQHEAPAPRMATPKVGAPGMRQGEQPYQYLQRMGQQLFGLRNDPGDSQTVGGRHTSGSEHYSGRAIDFGTARNSRAQLNAWMAWAKQHGFDVLDEHDHIHVSAPGHGI